MASMRHAIRICVFIFQNINHIIYGRKPVCLCTTSHTHTQIMPIKKHRAFLLQENDTAEKAMQFGLKELQRTLFINIKIMKKI